LKRKLLLAILAIVAATFMPLAASSQFLHVLHHHRDREAPEKPVEIHKYEIFAGYGYTSMNQVNQSRYGLQGANVSVTRDWGRFFGLTADGAYYKFPLSHPAISNSPQYAPSMDAVLLGPVVHAHLFKKYDGYLHVLMGVEHIGITGSPSAYAYPNISFAGGIGGGMDYRLNKHFFLRASGDDIISSFVAPVYLANPPPPYPPPPPGSCTTTSGCSPHEHRSSRASFGVVYKF
jgi:hypothetical protein